MSIDLSALFANDGSLPFSFMLDLSELDFSGTCPFVKPVAVKGTASGRAGVVSIEGTADYTYEAPCDRCAAPTAHSTALPFSHVIVNQLEDKSNTELIEAPDGILDIERLITDDVIFSLPSKFLCREDCKGICARCGKNLNDGSCGCPEKETDPRLAALKELL